MMESRSATLGLARLMRPFYLISLHLLLVPGSSAQTDLTPPSLIAHLQHGVNIGRFLDGSLENDSYSCCTEKDIADLRSVGFDHIRVLVQPGLMFDLNQPGLIAGKSLSALDQIVRNCMSQRLGIILAIALDEPRFRDKLAGDDAFVAKLADFWKSLANHYASAEYQSDLVFFEVLNEPGLNEPDLRDERWSGIQAKLAAAIRQGAEHNLIIATGAQKSDLLGLLVLSPLQVDRVIYVFHYYEPYSFTHQGETWNDSYAKFLKSGQVRYPLVPESAREAASQVPDWTQRLYALHDMEGSTKDRIEDDIYMVAEWAKRQGVTVICDEFGVLRTNVNPKDRAAWIFDVRELLEKYKIIWTFWDYSSDSFGLLTRTSMFDRDVVAALGMKVPSAGR